MLYAIPRESVRRAIACAKARREAMRNPPVMWPGGNNAGMCSGWGSWDGPTAEVALGRFKHRAAPRTN
jgi:hypothetical protein